MSGLAGYACVSLLHRSEHAAPHAWTVGSHLLCSSHAYGVACSAAKKNVARRGCNGQRHAVGLQATSEAEDKQLLLCGACGHEMAAAEDCIGSKAQPNPSGGMPMYIGRFTRVAGAEAGGTATWLAQAQKSYSWQMALCKNCGAHVGWSYEGEACDRFWGLLWSRLEKSTSSIR
eukprot:TRINITY_DN26044_c0_g1_i1.p1 TRINITY_DN26044_c0_g1~~TRINITY_DN26044_c0_g1_i1.p1  ORF type:complete len:174 (+),score=25.95 TRINITY_DN26044_c0_g1_i1:135-656(+)